MMFGRRRMHIPRRIDPGRRRIGLGITLAVGVVFLLAFARELTNVVLERIDTYYVSRAAQAASRAVYDRMRDFTARLDAEAANPSVQFVLGSGDSTRLAAEQERIESVFPTALRVRLLGPNVEAILPGPFPQPGFATIDVLKNAKDTTAPPAVEAHLFGHEGEHIDLVRRVDDANGQLLGFLLVSLPIETVVSVFQEAAAENGYFELRQGTASPRDLVMAARGQAEGSFLNPQDAFDIEGTRFHVAYLTSPRVGLLGTRDVRALAAGFASSLLLCILVIMEWRRTVRRRGEERKHAPSSWVPAATMLSHARTAGMAKRGDGGDDRGAQPAGAGEVDENRAIEDRDAGAGGAASAVPSDIFRAYDIRGVVGEGLTPETVRAIGQAIGSEARDRDLDEIVVGRDGRHSGVQLQRALITGLRAAGCDVIDIGMVTSPMLYYATFCLNTGSGVMVTGSHNPPEYNGLKIMLGGETLSEDDIRTLRERIIRDDLVKGSGKCRERSIRKEYIQRVTESMRLERPLQVVVDCGNGAAGLVAQEILESIGCQVEPLYCDVDGDFPNHHPDPSIPENVRDLMITVDRIGADLGIAFDGDADRIGVVTSEGKVIYPDRIMMLLAREILERKPGSAIIFDVKCSRNLASVITENGGQPVMWRTGHSLIKRKMKEMQAPLAGEMSGHIFFDDDWYGFDDAVYAAVRLLGILSADPRSPTAVFDELPEGMSTPELKVAVGAEGSQFEFMERFQKSAEFDGASVTTIDGMRADWPDGWGLIRCSNTTPNLVLRFEGDDPAALARIQEVFREQIRIVDPRLRLPF